MDIKYIFTGSLMEYKTQVVNHICFLILINIMQVYAFTSKIILLVKLMSIVRSVQLIFIVIIIITNDSYRISIIVIQCMDK